MGCISQTPSAPYTHTHIYIIYSLLCRVVVNCLAAQLYTESRAVPSPFWMRVNCADVNTMADTNLHVKNRGVPATTTIPPPPLPLYLSLCPIPQTRVPDLSVSGAKYVKHLYIPEYRHTHTHTRTQRISDTRTCMNDSRARAPESRGY